MAGVVGAAYPDVRSAMAIAAAFLAALATALTAYQSLYAFPQIAKLYKDAEVSLTALRAFGLGPELGASELRARVETIDRLHIGKRPMGSARSGQPRRDGVSSSEAGHRRPARRRVGASRR